MRKFFNWLLVSLIFGLASGVVSYFMMQAMIIPRPHNQASISEGDIILVTGLGPIHYSLYSVDSTGSTTLKNYGIIIETSAGAMEGYYESQGIILPGTYLVNGSPAELILSDNGWVDNPFGQRREDHQLWTLVKVMAGFGTLYGMLLSSLLFKARFHQE